MDSGKYRCVFNRGLTTGHTIDLQVLSTKKGLSAPETVKAVPGQRVQIVCKYIQDYLNATKSWKCRLRHSCQISEVDDRTRSELVLTISNVDIRDNGNVYTCEVALSDNNFISVDTKLTVEPIAPQNVSGTKGGRVTIRCKYPEPDYYYSKKFWCRLDNTRYCREVCSTDNPDPSGRVGIDDSHHRYFEVTIKNLEEKDSGHYRCGFVQNGSIDSITADVGLYITGMCSFNITLNL